MTNKTVKSKEPTFRKWRKIGGGSIRFQGRVIKPNETFWANDDQLPGSFMKDIVEVRTNNAYYRAPMITGFCAEETMPRWVFILAGGPSVKDLDLSMLKGQYVIAVNRSYEIYPEADVLFFADRSFYKEHEKGITESPIPHKVTVCKALEKVPGISVVKRSKTKDKLDPVPDYLCDATSGQMAINLACHCGAINIVLLGVDLQDSGPKHWHDGYRHNSPPKSVKQMLEEFTGVRREAWKKMGVDLLHGTPGSALAQIDYMSLDQILDYSKTMDYFGGWWLPKGEIHFRDMLQRSRIERGRLSYQYTKLAAALDICKKRSGMAIDVGSNLGFWSWHMAQEFKTVECFEPVPLHRECWNLNMEPLTNLNIHSCGLSDTPGKAEMFVPVTNCGNSHVVVNGSETNLRIELKTLDSFDFKSVDFIKIDCEGFELPVLKGAEKTLLREKPVVVVEQKDEWEDRYDYPSKGAVTYLQSLGAKVHKEIAGDYIMSWGK